MTPLFGSKVYGPWSDERLSAFEFMGMVSSTLCVLIAFLIPFLKLLLTAWLLSDSRPVTTAALPISSKLEAGLRTRIFQSLLMGSSVSRKLLCLIHSGKKLWIRNFTTSNFSSSVNTTIRIQTFPLRDGKLQLIVDAFEDGAGSSSNQFNTTADPLPFGITYAVFGDSDITTTANYFFRDGNFE